MVDLIAVVFGKVARDHLFDFARSDVVEEAHKSGMLLAADRAFAEVPPIDVLYLQRKIAGMYLIARHLGARVPVRELLAKHVEDRRSLAT